MPLRAGFPILAVPLMIAVLSGCSRKEEPNSAPSNPAAVSMGEGKAVFEEKCGVCHGLDRATARTETKERWKEIIRDMQGRRADWITDEDAARILDYLTSEYGK